MTKIFAIVLISITACGSPSTNSNAKKAEHKSATMATDTTKRPDALQIQNRKLLKSLDSIASIADIEKRKLGPDSTQAIMQWNYLHLITDSVKFKIFDLQDKFYTGYFVRAVDATQQETRSPSEYLLSSISNTNLQWQNQLAVTMQGHNKELIPATLRLASNINEIERSAYVLYRVQKVEVKVMVLDSLGVELAGFSVFCDSKFSKERDIFNPTKNAKKQIYPGTKIFYVQKGNIKRSQEAPISATDPNTWVVIINL